MAATSPAIETLSLSSPSSSPPRRHKQSPPHHGHRGGRRSPDTHKHMNLDERSHCHGRKEKVHGGGEGSKEEVREANVMDRGGTRDAITDVERKEGKGRERGHGCHKIHGGRHHRQQGSQGRFPMGRQNNEETETGTTHGDVGNEITKTEGQDYKITETVGGDLTTSETDGGNKDIILRRGACKEGQECHLGHSRHHEKRGNKTSNIEKIEKDAKRDKCRMPIDLIASANVYTILADAAGVSPADISITPMEKGLEIQVDKKMPRGEEEAGEEVIIRERKFGSRVRKILLPEDAVLEAVTVNSIDGIVTVIVPRRIEGRENTIVV